MKPTIELANIQFNPSKGYPETLTDFISRQSASVIHAAAARFKELGLDEKDYLIRFNSVTEKWNVIITATAFDASDFETRAGTIMTASEAQNY